MVLTVRANIMSLVEKDAKGTSNKKTLKTGVEKATKMAKDALSIARKVGEPGCTGAALYTIAQVQMMNAKLPEALKASEEAVNLFKTAGDQFNEAAALTMMAEVHLYQNDFGRARELAEEGVWLMQQIPDAEGEDFCWECVEKV